MVSKDRLIAALPDFKNQWVLLKKQQDVHDIIGEVLNAHKDFKNDYNKIALFFDGKTIEETADLLYDFCRKNIIYREESEDEQTVGSPGSILARSETGIDCKSYANFIGGVISALSRIKGKPIDWRYRFASYNYMDDTPHHVFIVVKKNNGDEIYIDPTPGSEDKEPVWYVDKKINDMPLYKISGMDTNKQVGYVWDDFADIANTYGGDLVNTATGSSGSTITDIAAAAATLIPGAGTIVSAAISFFSGLFGRPSDPAQSKIWFMYQIPKYNPTRAQVKLALDKIKADANWPHEGDWLEAYTIGVKAYQAIYDLLVIRDKLRGETIGYTSSTGIQINDEDVKVSVSDPQTGPSDLQAIANALAAEIDQLEGKSGNLLNFGTGSGSNTLLLIGAGIGAYLLLKPKRKVTGTNNGVLLIGGVAALLLLLSAKKSPSPVEGYAVTSDGQQQVNTGATNELLPYDYGDIKPYDFGIVDDPNIYQDIPNREYIDATDVSDLFYYY